MAEEIQRTSSRWRERVQALRNIPPVLRIVWEAAPKVIASSLLLRVVAALLPLAVLAVTNVIIDDDQIFTTQQSPLPRKFWWLVALEFVLSTLAARVAPLNWF